MQWCHRIWNFHHIVDIQIWLHKSKTQNLFEDLVHCQNWSNLIAVMNFLRGWKWFLLSNSSETTSRITTSNGVKCWKHFVCCCCKVFNNVNRNVTPFLACFSLEAYLLYMLKMQCKSMARYDSNVSIEIIDYDSGDIIL